MREMGVSLYHVLLAWHCPWIRAGLSTGQVGQGIKMERCKEPDPASDSALGHSAHCRLSSYIRSPKGIPQLDSSRYITLPSPAGLWSPASNPHSDVSHSQPCLVMVTLVSSQSPAWHWQPLPLGSLLLSPPDPTPLPLWRGSRQWLLRDAVECR